MTGLSISTLPSFQDMWTLGLQTCIVLWFLIGILSARR